MCWFDQTKQSFSLLFLILHITLVPFSNAVSGMRCSRELFCYGLRPEETTSALWPEEGFAFQIHCKSQIQVRTEKKMQTTVCQRSRSYFWKSRPKPHHRASCPKQRPNHVGPSFSGSWEGTKLFGGEPVTFLWRFTGLVSGWGSDLRAGLGCSFPSQLCLLCSPTMEPEADGERWH